MCTQKRVSRELSTSKSICTIHTPLTQLGLFVGSSVTLWIVEDDEGLWTATRIKDPVIQQHLEGVNRTTTSKTTK